MAILVVGLLFMLHAFAWPVISRVVAQRIERGYWARIFAPLRRVLAALDTIPRALTDFLVPTVAYDPPERLAMRSSCLVIARFIVAIWIVVGTLFAVTLVANGFNFK